MRYKCAIFDLDGTLIDSLQGILDACNQSCEELGLGIHSTYDEAKYFIGAGAVVFAERALKGKFVSEKDKKAVMDLFLQKYAVTQNESAKVYPGIIELLEDLKKEGYILCIASNKPHLLLKAIVKKLFGSKLFDIAYGQLENAPEKPNPFIIYQILNKLKIDKKDCVYVGDSQYDVETAENAGLESIIVKYGYGFYDEPWIKKATYIVDDIDGLKKLLV